MSEKSETAGAAFSPTTITIALLAMITALRIVWLAISPFDLYPDEAQYWVWSRHLAFGYFSKPPMIAWLIAGSTALLGDSTFAVKAFSPIIYFLTGLTILAIGRRLFSETVGALSAVVFFTLPGVWISAAVMSTDVPLLLFWSLATYAFVRAQEDGPRAWLWWAAVGVATGLGLLSKYTMGFWVGSALIFLLAAKEERRRLPAFAAAMAIALLVLAPNLVWNGAHGFATFHSTSKTAALSGLAFHPDAVLVFVASQFGVFGPGMFAVFLSLIWSWRRQATDRRILMLLCLSVPTLAAMTVQASLSRAYANWAAPTYVAATVLVTAVFVMRGQIRLVVWGVAATSAIVMLCAGVLAAADAARAAPKARFDPMHTVVGYRQLGTALQSILAKAPPLPMFGEDRRTIAEVMFYVRPHPLGMLRWNPAGEALDTFALSQSLPDRAGGDYLWVTEWPTTTAIVSRFQTARVLGVAVQPVDRDFTRRLYLVELQGFRGYEPGKSKVN